MGAFRKSKTKKCKIKQKKSQITKVNEWHCLCYFCTDFIHHSNCVVDYDLWWKCIKTESFFTLLDPTAYLWREVSVFLSLHLHHLKQTWVLCYSDCKSHLNKIWYFKYKKTTLSTSVIWRLSSLCFHLFIYYSLFIVFPQIGRTHSSKSSKSDLDLMMYEAHFKDAFCAP